MNNVLYGVYLYIIKISLHKSSCSTHHSIQPVARQPRAVTIFQSHLHRLHKLQSLHDPFSMERQLVVGFVGSEFQDSSLGT